MVAAPFTVGEHVRVRTAIAVARAGAVGTIQFVYRSMHEVYGCINNTFHLLVFTAFYGISSSIVRIFYHAIYLLMIHCRSEA